MWSGLLIDYSMKSTYFAQNTLIIPQAYSFMSENSSVKACYGIEIPFLCVFSKNDQIKPISIIYFCSWLNAIRRRDKNVAGTLVETDMPRRFHHLINIPRLGMKSSVDNVITIPTRIILSIYLFSDNCKLRLKLWKIYDPAHYFIHQKIHLPHVIARPTEVILQISNKVYFSSLSYIQ